MAHTRSAASRRIILKTLAAWCGRMPDAAPVAHPLTARPITFFQEQ